jgi:hypothetical protein
LLKNAKRLLIQAKAGVANGGHALRSRTPSNFCLRNSQGPEMTVQQNADQSARWDEELRFAKKQQWYVAASVVGLLGAIFAISRGLQLSEVEKAVATIFILAIAGCGIRILKHLQDHMQHLRQRLEPYAEKIYWHRPTDVFWALAAVALISGVVIVYLLWFPHANN